MVFHWFLCIVIDLIGFPLLLTLIHAASMVYSFDESFLVITHSMLIQYYITELIVSLKGIPLNSMKKMSNFVFKWTHQSQLELYVIFLDSRKNKKTHQLTDRVLFSMYLYARRMCLICSQWIN